jgi:hypothetical protein
MVAPHQAASCVDVEVVVELVCAAIHHAHGIVITLAGTLSVTLNKPLPPWQWIVTFPTPAVFGDATNTS